MIEPVMYSIHQGRGVGLVFFRCPCLSLSQAGGQGLHCLTTPSHRSPCPCLSSSVPSHPNRKVGSSTEGLQEPAMSGESTGHNRERECRARRQKEKEKEKCPNVGSRVQG